MRNLFESKLLGSETKSAMQNYAISLNEKTVFYFETKNMMRNDVKKPVCKPNEK
jgi:hypothetical protein